MSCWSVTTVLKIRQLILQQKQYKNRVLYWNFQIQRRAKLSLQKYEEYSRVPISVQGCALNLKQLARMVNEKTNNNIHVQCFFSTVSMLTMRWPYSISAQPSLIFSTLEKSSLIHCRFEVEKQRKKERKRKKKKKNNNNNNTNSAKRFQRVNHFLFLYTLQKTKTTQTETTIAFNLM